MADIVARLRAMLGLDASEFEAAIAKSEKTTRQFQGQLDGAKRGLTGMGSALSAVSSAAGNSNAALGGLFRGLGALITTLKADPIYAVATALAALAAAMGKYVEGAAEKMLNITEMQIKAYKELKQRMIEAMPETFGKSPLQRQLYEVEQAAKSTVPIASLKSMEADKQQALNTAIARRERAQQMGNSELVMLYSAQIGEYRQVIEAIRKAMSEIQEKGRAGAEREMARDIARLDMKEQEAAAASREKPVREARLEVDSLRQIGAVGRFGIAGNPEQKKMLSVAERQERHLMRIKELQEQANRDKGAIL